MADCLLAEAIYRLTSVAPCVMTIGTATIPAERFGPNTPVPSPPVFWSALP